MTFTPDTSRILRTGIPEVIYARHKTAEQINTILEYNPDFLEDVLITKLGKKKANKIRRIINGDIVYNQIGKIAIKNSSEEITSAPEICIISGGTSDIKICKEIEITLDFLKLSHTSYYDYGVAGIHRILSIIERLRNYKILIVCAGFEASLPSVLAGMVSRPIIFVPTSVGYGFSKHGILALMSGLGSCAPGIAVVNIDNGFGAAVFAKKMLG
jgi:NCAIR mutase (PurE)-related protein